MVCFASSEDDFPGLLAVLIHSGLVTKNRADGCTTSCNSQSRVRISCPAAVKKEMKHDIDVLTASTPGNSSSELAKQTMEVFIEK